MKPPVSRWSWLLDNAIWRVPAAAIVVADSWYARAGVRTTGLWLRLGQYGVYTRTGGWVSRLPGGRTPTAESDV